jgi:ribosomal protein S18 acetylase RimI-like enzyme
VIRAYEPERDRDRLRACIVELQEYERDLEPALPPGEEMADAYLRHRLPQCTGESGRIFVAELEGAIVGFVGVRWRVPPGEPDEDPAPYAYVTDLLVRRDHRRRGIGRALLAHAERHAREAGARTIRIGVLAHNQIARRLYREMGFADYHVQLVKPLY